MKFLPLLTSSSLRACSRNYSISQLNYSINQLIHQSNQLNKQSNRPNQQSNHSNQRSNRLNQQSNQLKSTRDLCTLTQLPTQKIILLDSIKKFLKNKDDHQKIKIILAECNPDEVGWTFKTVDKMVEVFLNGDYTFEEDNRCLNDEQIKELLIEYQILKSKRLIPPKFLTTEMMNDLPKLWTNAKRSHYLAYQGIKQLKKFKNHANKQIKSTFKYQQEDRSARSDSELNGSIFQKRRKVYFNQHIKLWNSAISGQNLVLDFSFAANRMSSEQNSIISQTQRIMFHNVRSELPFNLWFTGLPKDSTVYERFVAINLFSPQNFINRTEQHYSELFPKDKLVYLSPDAEETIDEFDHQAIYILGGIVDRYDDQPLSFNSAKQHNIRSVKLPLEQHVLLSDLALDLSFLNVFQMLNYMQLSYARWENAFRMYLQSDRKVDEFEIIDKFNPSLKHYSRREIAAYNKRVKHQYSHRIFKKINN